MSIKKGAPHGLLRVIAQVVGESGVSYGQTGQGLANGSTSNAFILETPKSANVAVPDRVTIDFTGRDSWLTSFQYGITSLGSFDFTLAEQNADFTALCTGTLVDQTSNDEWTEYTYDELGEDRPQLSLMFVHRMQSFEPATFGQTYYVNTVVPRCWVAPKGYSQQFQTAGEPTYQVTPASSARKITGEAFGSNLNASNNTLSAYHIISQNPLFMAVHRVTGTAATIVGTFKPVSSAVGTAGSSKNYITKFVEATGTATVGVADTITPADAEFEVGTSLTVEAGDLLTVLYETAYERPAA